MLALLCAAFCPVASGANEGLPPCAKLESAEERLACYDEVARRTQATPDAPDSALTNPSYLTGDWKLGSNDRGARRLIDLLEYRPSYLLLHWTNEENNHPNSPAPGHSRVENWSQSELAFQVSVKTELISRQAFEEARITPVLGHVGIDSVRLWFGYTQKMAWQVFSESRSRTIRETNYEPEAILTFGTRNNGNGLKLINLGLSHESNGLQQSEHRGWNRVYAQAGLEWGEFSVLPRAWRRIPEEEDDNPDIKDYMGHGDIVARYQASGYVARVLARRNFETHRGYWQLDLATPRLDMLGTLRLHAQITSGYGETLIDYNHKQTTVGLGVSIGD